MNVINFTDRKYVHNGKNTRSTSPVGVHELLVLLS